MYDYVIIGGGISGLYNYYKMINKYPNYKIKLLEKEHHFGGRILQCNYKFLNHNYSFPAGAARFNVHHKKVISLMKEFKLLDLRKDKGSIPNVEFIDSKNEFPNSFQNENGFHYIKKVIKISSNISDEHLINYTFEEFCKKYLKPVEVEFILKSCGYSGQLHNMNMKDAVHLFKYGISTDIKFWGGKYHLLINELVKYLKKHNASLSLNSNVKDISYDYNKDSYRVHCNDSRIYSKNIVLCTPKDALLKFKLLKPIHCILDQSISTKSLCRTYAIFNPNDEWYKNIKTKITTNNQLRHIIPMDPKNGLVMISYTDYKYTDYWYNLKNNQSKLKNAVVSLVKETFKIDIDPPLKVIVCYWKSGVAYWNKGLDSKEVSNFLINPMPNIYICGENYSTNQSWVEGALETCDNFLQKI